MRFDKIEKLLLTIIAICALSVVGMSINKEYAPVPVANNESKNESKMFKILVTGEVEEPGTYTVVEGSRICDVVYSAGGVTKYADIDIVDFDALVIADTEIKIPSINTNEVTAAIRSVNINTADADTLMIIPGIGDVIAQNIIDYRKINGSFSNIEEIMNVEGIGKKTFEQIKAYIITEEIKE